MKVRKNKENKLKKHVHIKIYTLEVNHHVYNGWFLLDDAKPLLEKWWFVNQPIKTWWLNFQGTQMCTEKNISVPLNPSDEAIRSLLAHQAFIRNKSLKIKIGFRCQEITFNKQM